MTFVNFAKRVPAEFFRMPFVKINSRENFSPPKNEILRYIKNQNIRRKYFHRTFEKSVILSKMRPFSVFFQHISFLITLLGLIFPGFNFRDKKNTKISPAKFLDPQNPRKLTPRKFFRNKLANKLMKLDKINVFWAYS